MINNELARQMIAATPSAALALQRAAYFKHPIPSLAERRADLRMLQRFAREQQDALCDAISDDYGHRSRHESLLAEITPVASDVEHTLAALRGWMKPQKRAIDRLTFGLARNEVIPQPLGVVGVIVPWNFPIYLSLVPLICIFAAGNRAMVKMSENSRHVARLLIDRMPAYFPPDKLQFFDETGGVGVEFSQLPFDHLLFTGSGATGRAVMAAAAKNLCPVTLELGGKSPAIVCDDYPLRKAAERLLYAKFLNAGQACVSVDHVWLPRAKLAGFVELARQIVPARYPEEGAAGFMLYEPFVTDLDPAQAAMISPQWEFWVPEELALDLQASITSLATAKLGDQFQADVFRSDYAANGMDPFEPIRLVAGGIALLVLFLGALSLVNISLVTIRQRIREIGIRRSFGAPCSQPCGSHGDRPRHHRHSRVSRRSRPSGPRFRDHRWRARGPSSRARRCSRESDRRDQVLTVPALIPAGAP